MAWWYTRPKFKDYDSLRLYVDGARFPHNGRRPIRSVRVWRDGTDIKLSLHNRQLATVSSEGIVTFTMTREDIRYNQQSLSQNLSKILPLMWMRHTTGKWRLAELSDRWLVEDKQGWNHGKPYFDWWKAKTQAQQYFAGLQFNMHTMAWVNPKPDPKPIVDKEKRKWWLAATRKFRRDIATMARIGAFENIGNIPVFNHALLLDHVANCLTTGEYTVELLSLLKRNAHTWQNQYKPKPEEIIEQTKNYIKSNSFNLRVRFGVVTNTEML